MCRHCDRIVEHPEDRPIVHAFVERAAQRLSELRQEVVSPDQIEISVSMIQLSGPRSEKLAAAGYRLLQEIAKESVW